MGEGGPRVSRSERWIEVLGPLAPALVAALSLSALAPPRPQPASAPPERFAADRTMGDIVAMARSPRPAGSTEHARVREELVDALGRLGLDLRVQDSTQAVRFAGRLSSARVRNVIGRLHGSGDGRAVLLAAHYDTVENAPGSADDGSGMATLLETARALKTGRPRNDVIFLFTDGEELGLLGALAFAEHPWAEDVAAVVNFDARGTAGVSFMFQTTANAGPLVAALGEAGSRPAASSLVTALARALPNGTDLSALERLGAPGIGFAFAERVERYHTAADAMKNLDLASVQDHGEHALALARHLADAELPLPAGAPGVYFDVGRRVLVRYPAWLAVALALATLALTAFVLARALRAKTITARGMLAGAGLALAAALVALGLSTGLHWLGTRGLEPAAAFALRPWSSLQAMLVAGALAVLAPVLARRTAGRSLAAGALALWGALLLAATVLAPGTTFALQWPLLGLAAGALPWLSDSGAGSRKRLCLYAGTLPGALLLPPALYAVSVAVGAALPGAVALFGSLALLLAWPVPAGWSARARKIVGAALLAGALLAGVAGRVGAPEGAPRADFLVHATDADSGEAMWVARGAPPPDGLAAAKVPAGSPEALLPSVLLRREPVRHAPAPAAEHAPPDVERTAGEGGTVALAVRSNAGARCLRLWQVEGPPVAARTINTRAPEGFFRFSPETDAKLLRWTGLEKAPPVWRLEHCGPPGDPLQLVLEAPASGVALRLVEVIDGLPLTAAELKRPAGLIPAQDGDVTLVGRRIAW